MDAAAAATTVRIAVNDVTGPPIFFANDGDEMLIPLRAARSLSRLDAVLRAEKRALADAENVNNTSEMLAVYHLSYKCPSFPRIERCSSMDELRLMFDADSMSPRLSNATLSQDLDGELFAMSISSLCVPNQQMSPSSLRNDVMLTRSASARTIRLAPTSLHSLLPPSTSVSATTTSTLPCRRVTRSKSCPSMSSSSSLQISASPSSLLQALPSSSQRHAGRFPDAVLPTTTVGKGRPQFGSDVDLDSEIYLSLVNT